MAQRAIKILFACMALALIVLVAAAGFVLWRFSKPAAIAEKSVLTISIEGSLPDAAPLSSPPFRPVPLSMWTIRDVMQKAATDSRIAAVWITIGYSDVGWGKVEEIITWIEQYRKSGKPIVAYITASDERGYSIAAACNEVYAPGEAFLELNGIAVEVTHLPGLLEKLGIKVQYERAGKYKSVSGERYGRKELTEPVREMVQSIVDAQYESFVDRVAKSRKMPRERLVELIDTGNFMARSAIAAGLVDADKDEIGIEEILRKKLGTGDDLETVAAIDYSRVSRDAAGLPEAGSERVALIHVAGMIVEGKGGFNPIFMEQEVGSDEIVRAMSEAAEDETTRAIVLRVDSPGGAGFGPDVICSKIQEVQRKKPVVVSMSDYGASGGYWVSMAAKKIVAEPSTITGSIGVWSIFPDMSGFNEKLGLTVDTVKRGRHADMLHFSRPLDDEEREVFKKGILEMYDRFVAEAARLRGMPQEKMEEVAQGRSWLGSQALSHGLVDALGGIDTAIELAKREGKIEGIADVWRPGVKSWYETILDELELTRSRRFNLAGFRRDSDELLRRLRSERAYSADPQRLVMR